jgi:hypothetical protein
MCVIHAAQSGMPHRPIKPVIKPIKVPPRPAQPTISK